VTNADLRQKRPRSYVPDCLTEEQYRQIKNEELANQKRLNFGMWGPRFKQVNGDPDNNWFNVPSLWTRGFDGTKNAVQNAGYDKDDGGAAREIARSLALCLRRYGLAYLMLLLSTQVLTRSLAAKSVLSSKWVAVRILLPLIALKPMSMLSAIPGRQISWLNKNGTTKLAGVIAAVMSVLAFILR